MSAPASASCASSTKRTRSSRSARRGVEDDGPRSECTTASHGSAGSSRRSARRNSAQRPALLLLEEGDAHARVVARRAGAAWRRRRRDDRVVAREEAAQQRPRWPRTAAVRASRRPKTSCTTLRATCVATTRSVGAWKVPTLSAREWRSAVLATLGANGSCTWQRSRAARSKRSEIVRATSIGSAARRRPGSGGSASPTARTRASPGAGSSAPRAHRLARVAHERARGRRGDDEHPVPARRELVGDPRHERVDVVAILPRVRRDLGDGQRLGHRAQDKRARCPALPRFVSALQAPELEHALVAPRVQHLQAAGSRRRSGRSGR